MALSLGSVLLVGGSRDVPASWSPLFAGLASSLVAGRWSVFHLGCAAGADALWLSSLRASGALVSVFAVGGPSGAGFWSGSAFSAVAAAAVAPGVSVRWFAGGRPPVPLRSRLMGRSWAAARWCGGGVFVLSSPSSRGSLAVAASLLSRGVPVWAVCLGFSPSALPLPVLSSAPFALGVSLARLGGDA